ncbi:MAG: hypothetical protein FGM15_12020 [Chthoniobacterales bacterium]|nr:hypothetical protein [Chthoniobacterales bacterium]
MSRRSRSYPKALTIAGALAYWAAPATAQQIENPSFEFPSAIQKPILAAPSESLKGSGWAWGHSSGIVRQKAGLAKDVTAYEGSQMAFVRGDRKKSQLPDKSPQHMFSGVISGLTPGNQYEVQWAQAGRRLDTGAGALTVILREKSDAPGKKPVYLQRAEPVTNKDEWVVTKHTFTATSPEMSLTFVHVIPASAAAGATGDETTFIDAVQVTPVTKPAAQ